MESVERDVLISRVVDATASAEDWSAVEALSSRDPSLWREIVQAQRDQAVLMRAVEAELAVADSVELPDSQPVLFDQRMRSVSRWLGWAAAAVIALAWAGVGPVGNSGLTAGTPSINSLIKTPNDALDLYLNKGAEAGRVLCEIPERVLLRAEPSEDGQALEVYYLRQILERATVEDAFRVGTDELGRPAPVRVTVGVRVTNPI